MPKWLNLQCKLLIYNTDELDLHIQYDLDVKHALLIIIILITLFFLVYGLFLNFYQSYYF